MSGGCAATASITAPPFSTVAITSHSDSSKSRRLLNQNEVFSDHDARIVHPSPSDRTGSGEEASHETLSIGNPYQPLCR